MSKTLKTIERDVSWMYFNHRILEEARKETVPVLERMSFLGIYSNNLDEFFRVRMAFINRTIRLSDPRTKAEEKERNNLIKQQKEINKLNARYSDEYQIAVEEVVDALHREGINIVDENHIDENLYARRASHIMLSCHCLLTVVADGMINMMADKIFKNKYKRL